MVDDYWHDPLPRRATGGPSKWSDICTYHMRIQDEVFRSSPPPPKRIREDTTRIFHRLGFFSRVASVLIPTFVARRYDRGGPPG